MRDHRVGAIVVVDGDRMVGIITERDLTRAMTEGADVARTRVADYMTSRVLAIRPEDHAGTAVRLMMENRIRHLPVVDERGRVAGLLSSRDLLLLDPGELPEGSYEPW